MIDRSHEYFAEFFCDGWILAFFKNTPSIQESVIESIVFDDVVQIDDVTKNGKLRITIDTSMSKYIITFRDEVSRKEWSETIAHLYERVKILN